MNQEDCIMTTSHVKMTGSQSDGSSIKPMSSNQGARFVSGYKDLAEVSFVRYDNQVPPVFGFVRTYGDGTVPIPLSQDPETLEVRIIV